MDAKSISQKRSEIQPVERQSTGSGSVRHYQKSGRTESNYSDISCFLHNGQTRSVFNKNLMALGEVDPMQANQKWHNYINNFQRHLREKGRLHGREVDQQFARDVGRKLREQIEQEKAETRAKMEAYRAAVDDQSKGYHERKHAEKMLKKIQDQRLKKETEQERQSFFRKKAERDAAKKQGYQDGLQEQRSQARRRGAQEAALNQELNAKNRNYLIDDSWKRQHERQLKSHLKGALINQMNDKQEENAWNQQKDLAEKEQYRDDLQRAVNSDLQKRREIEQAKQQIFKNEIRNQQMEGRKQREIESELKAQEDAKVKQKLINDHMKALDNQKRKNEVLKDHNTKVGQQMVFLRKKKTKEGIEAKKPYRTGLETKGDNVKYFDFLDCEKLYKVFKKKIKRQNRAEAEAR